MTESLETEDVVDGGGVRIGAIRRFSDAGIQSAVDQALASLGHKAKGAVIAYADTEGARLAVVGKLGNQWSVVGVLEKPWAGELDGQAAVRFAW